MPAPKIYRQREERYGYRLEHRYLHGQRTVVKVYEPPGEGVGNEEEHPHVETRDGNFDSGQGGVFHYGGRGRRKRRGRK